MMQSLSLQVQTLLDMARLYAALQSSFKPADLVASVVGEAELSDPVLMVDVLSLLQSDCLVEKGVWTMRPGPRRKVLDAQRGRVDVLLSGDETPVQQALAGAGDFAPDRLAVLIANPEGSDLSVLAATLDQAGPSAPAYKQLVALRAAMNATRLARRNDEILAKGFFGREDALKGLAGWVARPAEKPPLQSWHISGLPGIGKSYLLEKVIQSARLDEQPILVRLDFDRAALDVLNPYALFEEISRQFADAVPAAAAHMRELRMNSATERSARRPARKMRQLPRRLLEGMAEVANSTDRTVLVILDTLEVLRSRGETHIITLFEHLDLLLEFGMRRVVVISAGRGDALAPAVSRMRKHTELSGLEDWAAEALLDKRGVEKALWPRILPIAKGNPLLLALAGRALSDGVVETGDLPKDASVASIGGYLYRAILSRVPEDLRDVANQGLILRAINLETLQNVVAPVLGLSLDDAAARDMLDTLRTHHWLVETDMTGWVRHRTDVRTAFLPLIYADDPDTTAAIDRAAMAWFTERDPILALYHRLQLTRTSAPMPDVSAEAAAGFTEPMLDDLPDHARDVVLQAKGMRSDFGRTGHRQAPPPPQSTGVTEGTVCWSSRRSRLVFDPPGQVHKPDERAMQDLAMMIERGDVREAQFIVNEGFAAPFLVKSEAGILVLCQQWQSGHWAPAKRLWMNQGFDVLRQVLHAGDHVCGRLLMEVAAEFDFDTMVKELRQHSLPKMALELIQSPPPFANIRGALDFAALVALGSEQMGKASGAILGPIAHHLDLKSTYEASAAYAEADRLRQRIDVELVEHANQAMFAMMPLNPYGAFLAARAPTIPAAEKALDRYVMPQLAWYFGPGVKPGGLPGYTFPTAADKIDAFEALGLTAEWANGLTGYHALPDIPLIAASADRWRQAIAGVWTYGPEPPAGWLGRLQGIDDGAVALIDHILTDPATEFRAKELLLAWMTKNGDRDRIIRRYGKRYMALFERGFRPDKKNPRAVAHQAYHHLHKKGISMVVASPLAVLAALGFDIRRI